MNILSSNKIVVAAAALIIAGALWYGFSGTSSNAPVLGTQSADTAVNDEDKDLVAKLLQLRSVTLTGTIFASPVFHGLQDFSTDITQEPVGRVDPFSPLPASISQSAAVSGTNNNAGTSLFNKPR